MNQEIAVIGSGGWGTALALLLAKVNHRIRLWGYEPDHVVEMIRTRKNDLFLPGIELPESIAPTDDLQAATRGADLVVVVVPSKGMRSTAEGLAAADLLPGVPVLSCTKGIEHQTGLRMSEILATALPGHPVAVLSGPSHAEEVARGVPTAVVIGAGDPDLAARLQATFAAPGFRAYTRDDLAGIELGGALKNIFAIAAGVSDGLGLGDNTKAALVTRSLAELIRLGTAMGGQRETFQGLSGIGDLMVTCFSKHSRNRSFGERLGRGESPEVIAASTQMVAEGVPTARSGRECAQKLGLDTPVLDQVHAILYENRSPAQALEELLTRDLRPEAD